MTKKVLIITYYWPPSGGAGVQRWLKFVKYLPKNGWQPIIYTPEDGEMPSIDESLEKDIPEEAIILKTPIWEPYNVYKKFVGVKKDEKINTGFLTESKKPKKTEKLAVWIRGNFFIPDARKFWVKPSVKYLEEYLKANKVDAIISTGPPHSMHLIALGLKNKFSTIPWIADFRDPWTNIDFYKDLMLSKAADKKHHKLERAVLKNADVTLTIGKTLGEELKELGAKKVEVITNGFDKDDTSNEVALDDKFSLAHIGSMTSTRNPEVLWKALSELLVENAELQTKLEIKLVGKVDVSVMQSLEKYNLQSYLRKIDYLPHDEVIKEQQKSHVLLLLINDTPNSKGIVTGKFFEYMSAGRPILAIGPTDGDVSEILNDTQAGEIVGYSDLKELKKYIVSLMHSEKIIGNSEAINKYSREELTKKLVEILNQI